MSKTYLNMSTAICIIPLNIVLRPNTNFSIRQTLLWFFCVGIGQSGHHRGEGHKKRPFSPFEDKEESFPPWPQPPIELGKVFVSAPPPKNAACGCGMFVPHPTWKKTDRFWRLPSPTFFDGPLGHRKPNAHKNEAEEEKEKTSFFGHVQEKLFFLVWGGERGIIFQLVFFGVMLYSSTHPEKVFVQSCY